MDVIGNNFVTFGELLLFIATYELFRTLLWLSVDISRDKMWDMQEKTNKNTAKCIKNIDERLKKLENV